MTHDSTPPLIAALRRRLAAAAGESCELLETHISWVLLVGDLVYKIKKPVSLGFVDFSTLDKRKRCCEEELRLNRRLAPELYLDVVPITDPDAPAVGEAGEAVEYAVRMRRFPQEMLLPEVLRRGELGHSEIDALARQIAEFHAGAAVAGAESSLGSADRVCEPIRANFASLRFPGHETEDAPRLQKLSDWCEQEYRARYADFERRKATGHIRECHGDMHLGNMFLDDGKITIFDGIEFNETLRWIDVLSEIAFLVMDLEDRGHPDLGRRLLNVYLEETGDYEGLSVFRYYTSYRALVRAKVAAIRANQGNHAEAETARIRHEFEDYLTLAEQSATPGRSALLITHGVSGSGKSTGTQSLVEQLGTIRVRSDVERKRLAGIAPGEQSAPVERAVLYSAESGVHTYQRLAKLADSLLAAGFAVVVDATFLKLSQRDLMRELATRHQTPFFILDFQADEATLRERIAARQRAGQDPSEADVSVLECQLRSQEPLNEEEVASAVAINPGQPLDWQSLVPQMRRSAESGSS